MSEDDIDFYAYKLPIMALLAANTFFLVWIMVVSSEFSTLIGREPSRYCALIG